MSGSEIRLRRLIPDGQRIIILPIDHGEFQGPRKGLLQPIRTLRSLEGYDAVLLSPGMFRRCSEVFAERRTLWAIVRLNWNADYCFQWAYRDGSHARVLSPAGALALGADAALASLAVGTGSPTADAASVESFARLAEEARAAGIPLGGEIYPGRDPGQFAQDEFHDLVLRSCRIVSELGADFVKTFYTGARFAEVVEATPVPIIVLGASKEDEAQALTKAAQAIAAGARGVVFGRNVFESDRPQAFLDALNEVVREGASPDATATRYGFAR